MKKLIVILGITLVLAFMLTLTASATQKIYIGGFFYEQAGYDFCLATGDNYIKDGFFDGCGNYITANSGLGQTAIWEGTIDGKSGTCVFHLRWPKDMATDKSHGVVNQCTGDLAGYHSVAEGEFVTFTWSGWYNWEIKD